MDNQLDALEIYFVRSHDGQYFRAKGYEGSGESWVDDIKSAKMYTKISPCRRCVTYFATKFTDIPAPQIMRVKISGIEVVDDSVHLKKALKRQFASYEEDANRMSTFNSLLSEGKFDEARAEIEKMKKKKWGVWHR